MGTLAALTVVGFASSSLADIGACRDTKPPSNESEALDRAGFAFDGAVVGGRHVLDDNGQEVLVSPLRFRVSQVIKGNVSDYAEQGPSGTFLVRVWDATYARRNLKQKVLHDRGPQQALPGEISVSAGDTWRIYALSEVGNWTATTCLGSHPIEGAGERVQSDSPFPVPWGVSLLALVVAGVILLGWRLSSSRRSQTRSGV
jgi:hypothetical protein